MILGMVMDAVADGASEHAACKTIGLEVRTVQRWRRKNIGDDGRAGPRKKPTNALSEAERGQVLEIATSPRFRDKSPWQIVPELADEGVYLASEATFTECFELRTQRRIAREHARRRAGIDPSRASRPGRIGSGAGTSRT